MEGNTGIVTNALLASAEGPKVLGSFGHHIVVKLHYHSPFQLSTYAYVQKAPGPPHLSLSRSLGVSSRRFSDRTLNSRRKGENIAQ